MNAFESFGIRIPGVDPAELTGWLIAIEGTDGVGRTTHVNRLRTHLERLGYATTEAERALRQVLAANGGDDDTEALVRRALQLLTHG